MQKWNSKNEPHPSARSHRPFTLTGAAIAATDAPSRKLGYWELTTVAPMIGEKTPNVCITAKDDIVTP